MGIIQAVSDSVRGTFADQWKDIYTAAPFNEHSVVVPGVLKSKNNGRGANVHGSEGVITKGSQIFVPENTAAFIFSEGGIEEMILAPGTYEYTDGEESLFSNATADALFNQISNRVGFGGVPSSDKRVAFVNLREIRQIPFGTRGPQMYNDHYYKCDLEIYAYGNFSVQVIDPELFVRNFVPPNVFAYSFDYPSARKQLLSEFLQSFISALNSLSAEFRISQLPGQAQAISQKVAEDELNAGSWPERFGFRIVRVAVENIEFSPDSRELVNGFNRDRMSVTAFEGATQGAANIAAQQKIAQGVQDFGLGDGGGMLVGMNIASGIAATGQVSAPMAGATVAAQDSGQVEGSPQKPSAPQPTDINEAVEVLRKLKELLDMGILTNEEFEAKKKELLNL